MSTTTPRPEQPAVDVAELVALIDHIGGGVRLEELAYQLRRRGHPASRAAIMEALCEAEAQGLVTPYTWTTRPEASR